MTWFPQSANGCLVQLPLKRRFVWRAITNQLENGERISFPDPGAGRVEWKLGYQELSRDEATTLSNFFRSARGAFGTFSFVDPTANLLGWSEDLSRPDWTRGLLTTSAGHPGPYAGLEAIRILNPAPASQQLTQTVALPGAYTACFSLWLRADIASAVTLSRGSATQRVIAGPVWKRHYIAGSLPGEDNAAFALNLQAGQAVDVWGLQAEAGPWPSQYRPTTSPDGIYERTSFAADELAVTATGVDLFATEFTLISRL
jgi:hypothetical protein